MVTPSPPTIVLYIRSHLILKICIHPPFLVSPTIIKQNPPVRYLQGRSISYCDSSKSWAYMYVYKLCDPLPLYSISGSLQLPWISVKYWKRECVWRRLERHRSKSCLCGECSIAQYFSAPHIIEFDMCTWSHAGSYGCLYTYPSQVA